ncbi:phosphoglycerate dehydrogenase [[Pasteurella] aerogenes]|nr:phosphoglycerate dehydrogenase [[Pasteurella] aerogenes]MDY4479394.1 phosphoglycerate dehydrogenase [[Pasteurella] aerogenes]UWZ93290.1 phosphoglycerate dehydrogenase [[Pasteurella] aerogenes]
MPNTTENKVSLGKDKIKFLLLEGVHQSALDTLKAAGYTNIEYHKKALDADELKAAIKDAHFIGLRSRTHLTADVLAHAERLIAIGCFCIGTNQVDLKAAKERGIPVFNAPFSNTRSVAELVLGEILLLMRNVPQANAEVHRGLWNKSAAGSHEARGKKLGIIGYGHIGSQLSIIAESLGMHVYFYDIENKLPLGNAQQVRSLEELLSSCDVISLHVPENASTKNLMSAERIAQLKEGSILINAARGTVVDIDALAGALKAGKIRGAAIDVFPTEPASIDEEFLSPLREFDNVILTPHIGGSTAEAQENIGSEVSGKFVKYSDNGSTLSAVNFPEVSLPEHSGTKRLLHIHHNKPGVLNKINQVFVNAHINIAAQYLQTDPNIGYVVIDVESEDTTEVLAELKKIDGTIRARVLY